jgi:pimeloyl-ACP methyl ester carboxylesterase
VSSPGRTGPDGTGNGGATGTGNGGATGTRDKGATGTGGGGSAATGDGGSAGSTRNSGTGSSDAGDGTGSSAGWWTRRRVLGTGLGALAAGAVAGAGDLELVAHGVLPGRQLLDRLDGACTAGGPPLRFGAPGPAVSGSFRSRAREREVGYTIAYPPGHGPGSRLPLIVALHPSGASHARVLSGLTLAQALAVRVDGRPLPPVAMVAADGGPGYWNPHPGDDPMGMVVRELVPLCQRAGLGRGPRRLATFGISMGGYGAILLAEKYPRLFRAAAAIGPAVWTSYSQARAVNPGAYASARAFAAADVVTHAPALAAVAVRVACGRSDPFCPGVQALAKVLPEDARVVISTGCHSYSFFAAQEPPSLAFLAHHLTA